MWFWPKETPFSPIIAIYNNEFWGLDTRTLNTKCPSNISPPHISSPEYEPPKKCLRTSISPGPIFGILRYWVRFYPLYLGTIFAYGQTGTGKTFTMEGVRDNPHLRGITPNSFAHIFGYIAKTDGDVRWVIEVYVRVLIIKLIKDEVDSKLFQFLYFYINDLHRFFQLKVSLVSIHLSFVSRRWFLIFWVIYQRF